jgi:HK97 family phage major capsid protein
MKLKERLAQAVLKYQAALKAAQDIAAQDGFSTEALKVETDKCKALKDEIETLKAAVEAEGFVITSADLPGTVAPKTDADKTPDEIKAIRLQRAYAGQVTAFKADPQGMPGWKSAEQKALEFGHWFLAITKGREKSIAFCKTVGIDFIKTSQNESDNEDGGFLVPEQFIADLINLKEQYGVIRKFAQIVPMTSDRATRPRRKGGFTVYYPGEGGSLTTSQMTFDAVGLTARKATVYGVLSSELNEDTVIAIGNLAAEEIAYAYAAHEDDAAFNGDGTSTYGGIVGIRPGLLALSGTIANIAGVVVGTGNAYSELTKPDFNKVVARLPEYADTGNTRWFMHRRFYYEVCMGLLDAAGGQTQAERMAGINVPMFNGYPVTFVQKMPKVEGNSQICALLGDLRMATMLGDRRSYTIMTSEHARFTTDELAIRGTMRWDFKAHDLGNADATAANQVPGSVVALITAAS